MVADPHREQLLGAGCTRSFDPRPTPLRGLEALREGFRRACNAAITQLIHEHPPPGGPVWITNSQRGTARVSTSLDANKSEQRSHHSHRIDAMSTHRGRVELRANWIVRDHLTHVLQSANHLAGLWILNHDLLGEELIKMFRVAPI